MKQKNPYFYTNLLAWGLVLFLIGNYVFGWTTPTANPPSSNLPAPINVGSTEQTKAGNLIIEGVLRLGQFTTANAPAGADGALYFDTTENTTKIYSNSAWGDLGGGDLWYASSTAVAFDNDVYVGNDLYLKGKKIDWVYCDNDDDNHYAVNSSLSCPGFSTETSGDDCDDNCSTCYPGSTYYTSSPDGHDQDCNGVVDDPDTFYILYMSTEFYKGNLGGRSGADIICNGDINKPSLCTGDAWAFISVNAADEIRDMPTTKNVRTGDVWYWYCDGTTSQAAPNWGGLLDGDIDNNAYATGCAGSNNVHTFSLTDGALAPETCESATDGTHSYTGRYGYNAINDYRWINRTVGYCDYDWLLYCACNVEKYY